MTRREEVLINPQYKIIKKLLMKEFPFIINVVPAETLEQYKMSTYLDLIIDQSKLDDYVGTPMSRTSQAFVNDLKEKHDGLRLSFPHIFYPSNVKEKFNDIYRTANDIVRRVGASRAIPDDMKLNGSAEIDNYILK